MSAKFGPAGSDKRPSPGAGELGPERRVQTKEGRRPGCLCPESQGKRPGRERGEA